MLVKNKLTIKLTPTQSQRWGLSLGVCSTHWLSTEVGMSVLARGGNAFDAAIAAAFVLQIVEPQEVSLGGEVVMLLQPAESIEPIVVCGQGVAPARATISRYKADGYDEIPGSGPLAAVVPGGFDAWMKLLRDYGTLSLREIFAPAVQYAMSGYPVTAQLSKTIGKASKTFRSYWTGTAELYLPRNAIPEEGDLLENRIAGNTLIRILREAEARGADRIAQIEGARQAYYQGFVAEGIDHFVRFGETTDSSGNAQRGYLTSDDLASWEATYEPPITFKFRNCVLSKPGAWSQGPVLFQILALLDDGKFDTIDLLNGESAHVVIEAMKLAYADREVWYGDSTAAGAPLETLLSASYNDVRRRLIGDVASCDFRPGKIPGQRLAPPRFALADVIPDGRTNASNGDTCHISVVDERGNMICAVPSGGWIHGSPVVPDLGFGLGTRGQMFWLQEGLSSSLEPKKRPRTTLSPTIARSENGARIAFGSIGGDYQDQWNFQLFMRVLHCETKLQSAVESATLVTDHCPKSFAARTASPAKVVVGARMPDAMVQELRERGHLVSCSDAIAQARAFAVSMRGRHVTVGVSSTVNSAMATAL